MTSEVVVVPTSRNRVYTWSNAHLSSSKRCIYSQWIKNSRKAFMNEHRSLGVCALDFLCVHYSGGRGGRGGLWRCELCGMNYLRRITSITRANRSYTRVIIASVRVRLSTARDGLVWFSTDVINFPGHTPMCGCGCVCVTRYIHYLSRAKWSDVEVMLSSLYSAETMISTVSKIHYIFWRWQRRLGGANK